jgi:hypothetical protein
MHIEASKKDFAFYSSSGATMLMLLGMSVPTLFRLFRGRDCVLFRLFRRHAYAIQIVPWACLSYSNCSVGVPVLFKLFLGRACAIQIVPWACLCYSYCSLGVPVLFKLFHGRACVLFRLFRGRIWVLFRLFRRQAYVIQIVPWACLSYSNCSVGMPVLFKLYLRAHLFYSN